MGKHHKKGTVWKECRSCGGSGEVRVPDLSTPDKYMMGTCDVCKGDGGWDEPED